MLPSSLKSPGRNWPNLSVVAATHRSIVVEANDPKQIEKAAMIIRAYGHSTTEALTATPWKEFLGTL